MKLKVQRARGMKDIVGDEAIFYLRLRELATYFSLENDFKYIETPVVENVKTFTLSLGESSDVIQKEMFFLKGRENKEAFVLRPEGTASVVRAYFENGLQNWPQPVKLFYFAKMYRHERPQRGRLREHTQWGLEILNTEDHFADFFIIYLFYSFLSNLKIKNLKVKLNSLGCEKCRGKYIKHLVEYYKGYRKHLCSDCQRRIKLNPLRLLDCKNQKDQEYKENAPDILDYLCKTCKVHFQKVLEYVEYFKIPYQLDKTLVRGFDYYYRTVFEIFIEDENIAIVGGGRYDLGKFLARTSLPSVGGALGVERLKIIIDKIGYSFSKPQPKIFVAFASEEVRAKAFEIYLQLQKAKMNPAANFLKLSLSSQLEFCNKIGVKYSLILGLQEFGRESIILRDMESGVQETLKLKNLVDELKKILKK